MPRLTKIEAERIIRELNIAITYLSYPGRANGTARAESVDFPPRGGGG